MWHTPIPFYSNIRPQRIELGRKYCSILEKSIHRSKPQSQSTTIIHSSQKNLQYKEVLLEYITSRNIVAKSTAIQVKVKNKSLHESDMKYINNIYISLTKGVLFAKHKLKIDLHNSPRSGELQHRTFHLSYWRLVISQIQTKISHTSRISIIMKKLPTTFNTSYHFISNTFKTSF